MLTEISKIQGKITTLLLMRYQIPPSKSLNMAQQWINQHPQDSWQTLAKSLQNNLIKPENDQLVDLYSPNIRNLVNQMRAENGIEIKDRRYHLKTYSKCFIGSQAVKWLIRTLEIPKSEVLKLGQNLIEQKIIHHVTDDHDFKDDYLFYRFYIDE
jgi:hypothetical protein